MKKVNLVISRKFPVKHPRAGQTTGLLDKLLKGTKIHTIRDNIGYWEEKIAKVNAGEMYISAKIWLDRPYKSPQQEMRRFTKAGLQTIEMDYQNGRLSVRIDGRKYTELETLAGNDGLSLEDFIGWFFSNGRTHYKGAIIHFTEFRY
ncbi:hypothetical protein [Alistipes sp.]|uniref:hypothetical protein n=1 Tax=Alistipes sp. TaxID=1872444 RepID=UPI003AEF4996